GVIGAPSRCAVVALSPVGAAAPVGDNDFFRGGPMSPKTPVATGGAPVATGGRPRTAAGRVLGLDLEVDDLPGLGVHRVLGGEALGGQHPDLPLAVGGEEAEGALLTGHDLPDEVVGGVEQTHVGAGERLAVPGHRALDDRLVARVDVGEGHAPDRGSAGAHLASPSSTGTPISEPYSVQEPS